MNILLERAKKIDHIFYKQRAKGKSYTKLLPLTILRRKIWTKWRATLPKIKYVSLENQLAKLRAENANLKMLLRNAGLLNDGSAIIEGQV